MDGPIVESGERHDDVDVGPALPTAGRDGPEGGEGGSPHLELNRFVGPLATLLTLARAQKIEIGKISLAALVDQLVAALWQATANMPLPKTR